MTMERSMRRRQPTGGGEQGFTILETLVALSVLAVGLLGLAGVLAAGLARFSATPTDLIARQKAAEAIESVYTARDTRVRVWAQVRNVLGGTGADGGIFLDGAQPLRDPGADGLINTADDGSVEQLVQPGADGLLGTADDVRVPLSQYTREIRIRDISGTLRELQVTVTVNGANGPRTYVLTTLISSYA
jgi:prepilin-type N-terminal cleavage/methylation domain-containing protein